MTAGAKTERNRRIAEQFRAGASIGDLAREYAVTRSRIRQILVRQGVKFPRGNYRKLLSEHSKRLWGDPDMRKKIMAGIDKAVSEGRYGRRTVLADDPERREDYLTLRNACGAAYARQAMGLEA